jgi:hypothetical protein
MKPTREEVAALMQEHGRVAVVKIQDVEGNEEYGIPDIEGPTFVVKAVSPIDQKRMRELILSEEVSQKAKLFALLFDRCVVWPEKDIAKELLREWPSADGVVAERAQELSGTAEKKS